MYNHTYITHILKLGMYQIMESIGMMQTYLINIK